MKVAMRIRWFIFPAALLTLAGFTQPENSILTISFRSRGVYGDSTLARITIDEGRSARHIERRGSRSGQGLVPDDDPMAHAGPIPVGTHGTLPIRVDVVGSTGDTLSTVHAHLQLQPRYHFGVTIFAGYAPRPQTMCMVETYAAPIRTSPQSPSADSMFVLLGGLPVDAVC
jgi:hypothetical protein